MGISRITNADHSLKPAPYDRRQAYRVDAQGRPLEAVLIHPEREVGADLVFQPLPAWMHSPRWDGRRWRESSRWAGIIRILAYLLLLGCCLLFAVRSQAQNNDNIAKVGGVNQSGDNVIDTTNHAVKVNVVAGGGTGGGPADVGATTAASETDAARQKVTSAIRVLDTSQAAGSQLTALKGDGTSGAWVNCKAGCSSAADTTGSTVALGSLNANALVALVGTNSASVFIAGAGTLVGTIVPEVSNDGGTTWFTTFFEDPSTHALTTSQAVSSPAATMLGILLPGGADRARVRVSVYTSGSSNATLKAVAQFPNRPIKVSAAGVVSVDGSGATQPISAASLPLPTGAAQDSTLTGGTAKVRATGSAGGVLDGVGQNVAAPANWLSMGCDFFTSPTTITTGNGSPLECDSAGNLLVKLNVNPTIANTAFTANAGTNLNTSLLALDATVVNTQGTVAAGTAATKSGLIGVQSKTTLPTLTDGQQAAAQADPNARLWAKQYPDTTTVSFHASKKFAASSTTDVAVMPGNATNKVILDKVTLTCTQTTAGQINVELVKRSAADTAGTSASITAVPDYSSYAGAVSAPLSYTGTGPTAGTAVGDLDNAQIGCMASATATPNDIYVFKPAKPIILNGTAEQVAINLGGAITGGNITVTFDWRETTTP